MDVLKENRRRDLYLTDGKHVYFVPQNWPVQEDKENGTEIWCYAPTHIYRNSPIDILWMAVSDLNKLREVTEAEARNIHPALFLHLEKINMSECEDTGACTCDEETSLPARRKA